MVIPKARFWKSLQRDAEAYAIYLLRRRPSVRNTNRRLWRLSLIIAVLTVCGWSRCGSGTPSEYKELFTLPLDQQEQRFKQFPLDEQVEIYLRAMYVEPPLTRYASYIGSNGQKVLPVLLARLEREPSDTAKAHLFYAFKVIHEQYYSLRNENSTVHSLENVWANMQDQYRKNQCERYLRAIRENPGFENHINPENPAK